MTVKKLRFRARIQGKEVGVVAAITPPVDVPEFSEPVDECPYAAQSTDSPSARRSCPWAAAT